MAPNSAAAEHVAHDKNTELPHFRIESQHVVYDGAVAESAR
jgi:hypothetical protein